MIRTHEEAAFNLILLLLAVQAKIPQEMLEVTNRKEGEDNVGKVQLR